MEAAIMEKKMGMQDNHKVSDNHQQGIERVKMRSGDLKKGQGGKMGCGDKAHWSRPDSAGTPRPA
jgi:hypothetical protein